MPNAKKIVKQALWSEAMMLECTGCGSRDSIETIRRKFPKALSCCPERSMQPVVAYLREIDGGTDNACWVVCLKGDPGAVLFIAHDSQ